MAELNISWQQPQLECRKIESLIAGGKENPTSPPNCKLLQVCSPWGGRAIFGQQAVPCQLSMADLSYGSVCCICCRVHLLLLILHEKLLIIGSWWISSLHGQQHLASGQCLRCHRRSLLQQCCWDVLCAIGRGFTFTALLGADFCGALRNGACI